MPISACPIATVMAPADRAWRLLAEPANYALWWDAETRSITPQGPAQAGQTIYAQTRGVGKRWDVHIEIEKVEADKRQIHLKTMLPLGITVYNHITCTPIDTATCRITFG